MSLPPVDPGAWRLPPQREEKPVTFGDVGIFNRQQARDAGIYTRRSSHRLMAVPKKRRNK